MSAPDANGWMPIDSAPRDGRPFLGFGSYLYPDDKRPTTYIETVEYSHDPNWPWYDRDGNNRAEVYSHWQPLPKPPVQS